MIPESFIQDLLSRVDIVDVVGRYVKLRKGGANLIGLCPFHNEKTPSFTVSPIKQFYHCFGCGAHGSALHFLTEHTGVSFPEAVRSLAASVGMSVPEESRSATQRAADRARREERSRGQQVLQQAQDHYRAALRHSSQAVAYLKKRGVTGEIAARFGLGWASSGRRDLAQVFPRYDEPALLETGLVVESEDGQRHDRFRGRVMFPIHDGRGGLIGFGGRLVEAGEPKYLNSPETPLFSKGRELYGLHLARAGIHSEGCVLVVEGYMDVVALAQYGLTNVVATLGTATTPMHVQKLRRSSDRIVFSFDGDAAGRKAAWRALQACLPWVAEDVSMRFLFLPQGHDPDSYVRAFGVEALRACITDAVPLSRFLLDELAARHPLDEAEGRAACVHGARPLLAQMPEGGFRLQVERELARMVRLTPEELASMLRQPAAGTAQRADGPRSHAVPGRIEPQAPGIGPDREQAPRPSSTRGPGRLQRPRRTGSRAVTPMARRLLRLLLAHPLLVTRLGDQQLELLAQHPHLTLVRDLIALVGSSGAHHAGALLQAAEPDSELAQAIEDLSIGLLAEELPDPQAEWDDALRVIECQTIQRQCDQLIETGLETPAQKQRYLDLSRRLARLKESSM